MSVTISDAANAWLASGERGISSEIIFQTMTGLRLAESWTWFGNHPHDPDDFKRCEKLLRAVPEFRERLGEMREVSFAWAALVDHWDELVRLLDSECPGWESGSWARPIRTFRRMHELLTEVRARSGKCKHIDCMDEMNDE